MVSKTRISLLNIELFVVVGLACHRDVAGIGHVINVKVRYALCLSPMMKMQKLHGRYSEARGKAREMKINMIFCSYFVFLMQALGPVCIKLIVIVYRNIYV